MYLFEVDIISKFHILIVDTQDFETVVGSWDANIDLCQSDGGQGHLSWACWLQ